MGWLTIIVPIMPLPSKIGVDHDAPIKIAACIYNI